MRKTSFILAAIAMITGCNTVDSTNIDTAGLYADLQAVAESGSTEVTAWLKLGSGSLDFVSLESGDHMTASMMESWATTETTQSMVEGSLAGATWYSTTFYEDGEDTQFRVELDRAGTGKVSAPDSYATLPAPFTVTQYLGSTPTGTTSFSRTGNAGYYIEWSPTSFAVGDVLAYEITGTCIQTQTSTVNWVANYALQLDNNALPSSQGHTADTCDITVSLTVTRTGAVDPAFGEGGVFIGVQKVDKTYTVLP